MRTGQGKRGGSGKQWQMQYEPGLDRTESLYESRFDRSRCFNLQFTCASPVKSNESLDPHNHGLGCAKEIKVSRIMVQRSSCTIMVQRSSCTISPSQRRTGANQSPKRCMATDWPTIRSTTFLTNATKSTARKTAFSRPAHLQLQVEIARFS